MCNWANSFAAITRRMFIIFPLSDLIYSYDPPLIAYHFETSLSSIVVTFGLSNVNHLAVYDGVTAESMPLFRDKVFGYSC